MPRYVSPSREPSRGRDPSASRSPSRTTTSRSGRPYTDGVYTPTSSERSYSPSPVRSRSRRRGAGAASTSRSRSRIHQGRGRGRSPSESSDSLYYSGSEGGESRRGGGGRSHSRTRSRSTVGRTKQAAKERLSSILDTSGNTKQEKAENVVKTSLVMLGAIGAASLAAHKFWPKGITYGDKDDWELEKEEDKHKLKKKLREGRDLLEGRTPASGGDGPASRRRMRRGSEGDGDDDEPSRRRQYLRERYQQRPALPRAMDGDEGAQFWDRRARVLPDRHRYSASYLPDEGAYYDQRGGGGGRYVEPPPPMRRLEAAPLPPPAAPAPPRNYADDAPLVVPAGANYRDGREGGRGRYYVDGNTIVVPSSGDRAYVIERGAPPGQRLRERGRDGGYYR